MPKLKAPELAAILEGHCHDCAGRKVPLPVLGERLRNCDKCEDREAGNCQHDGQATAIKAMAPYSVYQCPAERWPARLDLVKAQTPEIELPPQIVDYPFPLVVIVGLHRSLSSCLAEILMRLGIYMGETNHGGEDREFARLCERMMPFPTTEPTMDLGERRVAFREWLRGHCERADGRPIGVKYPHLCVLSDDLLVSCLDPVIVHAARRLDDSVRSLTDRSADAAHPFQANGKQCRELQERLFAKKMELLARWPHRTVVAERLLADPWREVTKLVNYLIGRNVPLVSQSEREHVPLIVDQAKAPHTSPRETWPDNTTVLIKTMDRPDCLTASLAAWKARYPEARIVVADDGQKPVRRHDVTVILLPHDSGLSLARNRLVEYATMPYVLIADDDMVIGDGTRIQAMHDAVAKHGWDIVGGEAEHRPYCRDFYNHDGTITTGAPRREAVAEVQPADIVLNFFVARRESLMQCRWNDALKVGEHIDFFLRARELGLRVGAILDSRITDNAERPVGEYAKLRQRAPEFRARSLRYWRARWKT